MERRKSPRISIRKLAYVNFEPDNAGGVITDVSRAGLRFHTVAPVQQRGPVRLSLVLGATKQFETVGELVWTDGARQVGGVRFVVLPPAAGDEIENWARAASATHARSETANQVPSSDAGTSSAPGQPDLSAQAQKSTARIEDEGMLCAVCRQEIHTGQIIIHVGSLGEIAHEGCWPLIPSR
jgi:hypothetical protein